MKTEGTVTHGRVENFDYEHVLLKNPKSHWRKVRILIFVQNNIHTKFKDY